MSAQPAPAPLLGSSLSSARALMGLNAISRILTFVLNSAVVRLANPDTFGIAAVHFELLINTALFLARDAVRTVLPRYNINDPRVKNLARLPAILGFPIVACVVSTYFFISRGGEASQIPGWGIAVAGYGIAAVVELCAEPWHNRAMSEFNTGLRVRAEGLGAAARTLATFFMLWLGAPSLALPAFAAGQLAYASCVFLRYAMHYGVTSSTPGSPTLRWYDLDHDAARLTLSHAGQAFVKHSLTEADKLVLAYASPLKDQGGYAVASNYGSLIARIVFQPIEEIARVYFSKTLNSADGRKPGATDGNPQTRSPPLASLEQSANALKALVSVETAASLVLLTFGPHYLSILLPLLLPERFIHTSAPRVLAAYLWYIPVLALNGTMEAFFAAVASPADLARQSKWMAGFSVLYAFAAAAFYRIGAGDPGLVYANIVNFGARIIFAFVFASRYFSKHGERGMSTWKSMLPSNAVLATCSISLFAITQSERLLGASQQAETYGRKALYRPTVVLHIGCGGFLALICCAMWWNTTGRHLTFPTRSKTE